MAYTPAYRNQIFNVWYRNFLLFRRSWTISAFWILFEPAVILGAIGFGVGAYINNINGVAYMEFFFPALLCSTSMMVSFFEATYSNFSKLTYQQTYKTMILTPIEPSQIVLGEILWAASKGFLSGVSIALVARLFGVFDGWNIFAALAVVFLSSFVFASLGMLVTSLVKNYDSIIYPTSGLIVPMAMLCGTYFPIDQYPQYLQYVIFFFPLSHSVTLVRSIMFNNFEWVQIVHIVVLTVYVWILYHEAARRIEAKLIQ